MTVKILKIAGCILAFLIVAPIALGLVLKWAGSDVPPPGQLVDAGGHLLHINCMGEQDGLPPVVIEAGAGTPSPIYHWLQSDLSKDTLVCVYDRAGLAWSEEGNQRHDSVSVVGQLHNLLENAGIRRPFIFVGHSVAGLHMRVYQHRYPYEVSAIAFLDASHPDQEERLGLPANANEEAVEDQVRLRRILIQLGLYKFYDPNSAALEESDYPTAVKAQLKYIGNQLSTIDASVAEIADFGLSTDQARVTGKLGDIPIVVITAGEVLPEGALPGDLDSKKFTADWIDLQRDLAKLSSRSKHTIINSANHMSLVTDRQNAEQAAALIRDHIFETAKQDQSDHDAMPDGVASSSNQRRQAK